MDDNLLKNRLDNMGIVHTPEKIKKLDRFFEMMVEKNKVMNLTGITEYSEVVDKHFIDSLSLVNAFTPDELSHMKIIDVGTGAGFPGVPLKIIFDDMDVTLMDSLNKRLIYLDEVIDALDLKYVRTLHARAEELGRNAQHREQYDLSVSRAVANLSSLCEFCLPFVKVGGYFVSYKSGASDDEINAAAHAITVLGGKLEAKIDFVLPGTDLTRTLVKIKKVRATDNKYPRGGGKPLKNPL